MKQGIEAFPARFESVSGSAEDSIGMGRKLALGPVNDGIRCHLEGQECAVQLGLRNVVDSQNKHGQFMHENEDGNSLGHRLGHKGLFRCGEYKFAPIIA